VTTRSDTLCAHFEQLVVFAWQCGLDLFSFKSVVYIRAFTTKPGTREMLADN
jgi:hypothetical protein